MNEAKPHCRMTSGRVALQLLCGCVLASVVAASIPEDALSRWPSLQPWIGVITNLLPGIERLAIASERPEQVKLYYAILWMSLPAVLLWSVKLDQLNARVSAPTAGLSRSVLALVVLVGAMLAAWFVMGFGSTAAPRPLLTGGRGNALYVALTGNAVSMGFASFVTLWSICAFAQGIFVLTRRIFVLILFPESHVGQKVPGSQ